MGGLWTEGSALDRADKRVSGAVFRLRLPEMVELLLSVPGAFMGFPHAFFGPTPLALAWLASPAGGGGSLAVGAVAAFLFGASVFYAGLAGKVDFRKSTKMVLLVMPAIALSLLASPGVTARAADVGRLSLSCAALAVSATIPFKALFDRQRPAAALNLRGQIQERRAALLGSYIEGMCMGGQSRESLPSSDAAVMAANAVLLWRLWVPLPGPWSEWLPGAVAVLFFGLACFGRMYLWAHHLLDVSVGGLFGAGIAYWALAQGFGSRGSHVAASLLIFVLAVLGMQRRTKIFNTDERVATSAQ